MQPAWILFRAFDDSAVSVLGQTFDELHAALPDFAPETVATAVLAATDDCDLCVERLRRAAMISLTDVDDRF